MHADQLFPQWLGYSPEQDTWEPPESLDSTRGGMAARLQYEEREKRGEAHEPMSKLLATAEDEAVRAHAHE
jgi:hypothetical protein